MSLRKSDIIIYLLLVILINVIKKFFPNFKLSTGHLAQCLVIVSSLVPPVSSTFLAFQVPYSSISPSFTRSSSFHFDSGLLTATTLVTVRALAIPSTFPNHWSYDYNYCWITKMFLVRSLIISSHQSSSF